MGEEAVAAVHRALRHFPRAGRHVALEDFHRPQPDDGILPPNCSFTGFLVWNLLIHALYFGLRATCRVLGGRFVRTARRARARARARAVAEDAAARRRLLSRARSRSRSTAARPSTAARSVGVARRRARARAPQMNPKSPAGLREMRAARRDGRVDRRDRSRDRALRRRARRAAVRAAHRVLHGVLFGAVRARQTPRRRRALSPSLSLDFAAVARARRRGRSGRKPPPPPSFALFARALFPGRALDARREEPGRARHRRELGGRDRRRAARLFRLAAPARGGRAHGAVLPVLRARARLPPRPLLRAEVCARARARARERERNARRPCDAVSLPARTATRRLSDRVPRARPELRGRLPRSAAAAATAAGRPRRARACTTGIHPPRALSCSSRAAARASGMKLEPSRRDPSLPPPPRRRLEVLGVRRVPPVVDTRVALTSRRRSSSRVSHLASRASARRADLLRGG